MRMKLMKLNGVFHILLDLRPPFREWKKWHNRVSKHMTWFWTSKSWSEPRWASTWSFPFLPGFPLSHFTRSHIEDRTSAEAVWLKFVARRSRAVTKKCGQKAAGGSNGLARKRHRNSASLPKFHRTKVTHAKSAKKVTGKRPPEFTITHCVRPCAKSKTNSEGSFSGYFAKGYKKSLEKVRKHYFSSLSTAG